MSCNCSQTSNCNSCNDNKPCNCPPDYRVDHLPVNCGCCPEGYTWSGPTPNWPNGVCTNSTGMQTSPIPCNTCGDGVLEADCIVVNDIDCAGIKGPVTLSSVLEYILCSTAFKQEFLAAISTNQTLYNGFCNLVQGCGPVPGVSTPVLGPISWSIP